MKKIVIATPVDYSNFGNRLQNYAVHKICGKYGWVPTTLAVEYAYTGKFIPKHFILNAIGSLKLNGLFSNVSRLKKLNKSIVAWNFTKQNIRTIYVKKPGDLEKFMNDAELFGIGGDQVLSPYWHDKIGFVTYQGMPSNKKVCFAPSFGSDTLPSEYESKIMDEFREIEYPAIREQSGCNIIQRNLCKTAFRICDPVVMLTKADWEILIERCKGDFQSDYVLVYCLGSMAPEKRNYIESVANINNCKIIDVSYASLSKEAACDPLEFVAYIRSAKFVYTDSFHAIMLSLILNKNVVIFEREGGKAMNTRINELIERYGLSNCTYNQNEDLQNKLLGLYDIDNVNTILESERNNADEYYRQFQ